MFKILAAFCVVSVLSSEQHSLICKSGGRNTATLFPEVWEQHFNKGEHLHRLLITLPQFAFAAKVNFDIGKYSRRMVKIWTRDLLHTQRENQLIYHYFMRVTPNGRGEGEVHPDVISRLNVNPPQLYPSFERRCFCEHVLGRYYVRVILFSLWNYSPNAKLIWY